MRSTLHPPQITELDINNFLNPLEIIDAMIELKIQLQELEHQIQALQPAFFAACLTLNADKIQLTRATITRRLTPGQWTYSIEIMEQEDLLKQCKRQFQQAHEPSGGREITWSVKLLLNLV